MRRYRAPLPFAVTVRYYAQLRRDPVPSCGDHRQGPAWLLCGAVWHTGEDWTRRGQVPTNVLRSHLLSLRPIRWVRPYGEYVCWQRAQHSHG